MCLQKKKKCYQEKEKGRGECLKGWPAKGKVQDMPTNSEKDEKLKLL